MERRVSSSDGAAVEPRRRRVAIVLFEGVELLDFAGPFEVFSSVRHPHDGEDNLLETFTVAESLRPLTCRNGLVVQPSYELAACPPFDVLLAPGGRGTRTAVRSRRLVNWIAERSRAAELTTSVCTGSFLLAQAGVLGDRAVTTHWGSVDRLRRDFPELDVRENSRWVEAGDVITSAGVSAGIDMALHIVERLYGVEVAAATARGMEYDHWPLESPATIVGRANP